MFRKLQNLKGLTVNLVLDLFKVVDSCRIFSTRCSDTFRSFLENAYGKEQESQKNVITVQKIFLRGFDRKNMFFEISRNLIRKTCFQMTLNVRKS